MPTTWLNMPDKEYCLEVLNVIKMLRSTPNMNTARDKMKNILLFSMTLYYNGLFIKMEYELFICPP